MTTTLNVSRKIYRPHGDLPTWTPTNNAFSEFRALTSLQSSERGNKDIARIQSMNSKDFSPLLQGNVMCDSHRTPQKKNASNSVGFFRPFDTPPRKIQKLSIDSNNNCDILADGEFEGNIIASRLSSNAGDTTQNNTKEVQNLSNHQSGSKPSIFRTIDQLAYSSSTKSTAVPVQDSTGQPYEISLNFCTSTPKTNHRSIRNGASPLSSMSTPLMFDIQRNFWDHNQGFGTPTNIFYSNPNQRTLVQDTPPYTLTNVVRPKPKKLLPLPQFSNKYSEAQCAPLSGQFNNVYSGNMVPQFKINVIESNPSRRNFNTEYNTEVGNAKQILPNHTVADWMSRTDDLHNRFLEIVPQTTSCYQPCYLDSETSRSTADSAEKNLRSIIRTQDPRSFAFSNINSERNGLQKKAAIDSVNCIKVKEFPISASLNSGELQRGTSCEELIDVTTLDARFECRVCRKVFSLQRLLDRHVKRHSDVKRSICTFCNKGFNDAFDLKRHVRTHTGVRPFKCEDCGKAFTQRGSLELHTSNVHKRQLGYAFKERRNKVYVCEQCGHSEENENNYYNHIQLNHPNVTSS